MLLAVHRHRQRSITVRVARAPGFLGAALVLAALFMSAVVLVAVLLSLVGALGELWLVRLGEPDRLFNMFTTVG